MTKKKSLGSELGRGTVRFARAILAGALMLPAQTLIGQPAPNVVAWGIFCINATFPPSAPPAEATNVVALSDSGAHALALRGDGTIVAWGSNEYGETSVPPGLTNVLAVVAGLGDSLALRSDGTVAAWGYGWGAGAHVVAGLTNVVAIADGEAFCMALRSDHSAAIWSIGATNGALTLTNANVVAIAASHDYGLMLRADGKVATVGSNSDGPGVTNIPPNLTNAAAIAAGNSFALALTADGTVFAWGDDLSGETNVPPDLTKAAAIAAGDAHGLALASDGAVVAWGDGSFGQTEVPAGLTNVVSVAAGGASSMAVVAGTVPPTQVALTDAAFAGGRFTVRVPTNRGRVYALEYKDSLSDAQWTLLPLLAGSGGAVTLSDAAPGPNQRFYRVRRW